MTQNYIPPALQLNGFPSIEGLQPAKVAEALASYAAMVDRHREAVQAEEVARVQVEAAEEELRGKLASFHENGGQRPTEKAIERAEAKHKTAGRETAALLVVVERAKDKVLATVEEIRDEWTSTVAEQAEARRQRREQALAELAKADRAVAEAEALGLWLEGFPNGRYFPQPAGVALKKPSGERFNVAELLDQIAAVYAGQQSPQQEAIPA